MKVEKHRDETFNRAMKFVENFKQHHPGISSIYVFTSVDKEGNLVDEKYGMNLMTDYGFKRIYQQNDKFDASSVRLYVGSGDGEIKTSDTTLFEQAFGGLAATNSNTSKAYNYPIYYNKGEHEGEGLITLISRFLVAYYPYNVTGYPGEIYLSEYGLGTSPSALWTHSHIYDVKGDKTSILKKPEEELYITVYMCLSLYESIIQDGWKDDRYMAITTNYIMYNRMQDSNLYTYKRGNKRYDRTSGVQRTIDTQTTEGVFTNSTIMQSFTMYDGYDDSSGYIDGFIFYCSGMIIVEPQYLENTEDFSVDGLHSLSAIRHTGFSEKFGTYPSNNSDYTKYKYPSITRLKEAKAYLYDWKTQSWTNELKIHNPDKRCYDDTPSSSTCALPIYYSNRGEIMTGYLYQNIYPDDDIVSINSAAVTIYAADKYWDYSTWIWIQDYNDIPDDAKNAKYWITNDNTNSLNFIRKSDTFQLLDQFSEKEKDNGYELFGEFPLSGNCLPQCDNYEYGWCLRGNTIFLPYQRRTVTVGSWGAGNAEHMTYKKWLLTFNHMNNKIWVTDMTNAKNSGGDVTPKEANLNFLSTGIDILDECYRTETGTGIICIQSIKSNVYEAVIINLTKNGTNGSDFAQEIKKCKMSCCIWGTNKIAFIYADTGETTGETTDEDTNNTAENHNKICIYNCETQHIEKKINIPDGVTSIPLMFGHKKYLWFKANSNSTYVVDIEATDSEPKDCDNNIAITNNFNRVKMTAVDEVFIIYRASDYMSNGEQYAYWVHVDTEEHAKTLNPMSEFNVSNSYCYERMDYFLRYIHATGGNNKKEDNNNKTLMLLISRGWCNTSVGNTAGSHNRVIDFGQYLVDRTIARYTNAELHLPNYILYGEYFMYDIQQKIPIVNWLPIKIVGKTDTITTFNDIKNISKKQWLLSYTNTPTWGDGTTNNGKPPGTPQAVTDKKGEITRWS